MVDWSKPVQTKDGDKARLLGKLEGKVDEPYIVAVKDNKGNESVETYTSEGKYMLGTSSPHWDLINVPEKIRLHIVKTNGRYSVHECNDDMRDIAAGVLVEVDAAKL